jgi:branched-chain amino acid transport system permease protein
MAKLLPGAKFSSTSWSSNRKWAIGYGLAAVVIYLMNHYLFMTNVLNPQVKTTMLGWLNPLTINEALVYAIMALGLNIVVGYAGLLDLGFVAFWAIGGYVAGWLMSGFFSSLDINIGGNPGFGVVGGIHLPFWVVLLLAGAFTAVWGVIIGAPTLRLKSDYLALVTLGFGEIIPEVFRNGDDISGYNITGGNLGIAPIDAITVGSKSLGPFDTDLKFVIYSLIVAFVIMVSLRLREGRLGRAWLAIREDELAASMMGVPLMRTKLAAYAVGATAGGFGGVVFATHIEAVLPDRFQFAISIILLAMVVLGGMGNVWGVLTGSLLLAWFNSTGLKQIGVTINSVAGTDIDFTTLTYLLFGGALILMMLFRREGFIPEARTRAVMNEPERTALEHQGAEAEYVEAEEHVSNPKEG